MSTDCRCREEKAKLEYLCSVIEEEARRKLGASEAARDCVVIFLENTFKEMDAQRWPLSPDAVAQIAVAAVRCAETEARRLRRLRARETLDSEMFAGRFEGAAVEVAASADLGPEQRTILSSTIRLIGYSLKRLPACNRAVFSSIFLEHKTPSEIARETGRSQQSVDRSVCRLKAAIKRMLSGSGLNDPEIADLLNQLDRWHNQYDHGKGRHR